MEEEHRNDDNSGGRETEIDKVFRLVQDLKQKDLEEHKRKIEEKRLRLENIELKSDIVEKYKSDDTNSEKSSKKDVEYKLKQENKHVDDSVEHENSEKKQDDEDKVYKARLYFSKTGENSKTSSGPPGFLFKIKR